MRANAEKFRALPCRLIIIAALLPAGCRLRAARCAFRSLPAIPQVHDHTAVLVLVFVGAIIDKTLLEHSNVESVTTPMTTSRCNKRSTFDRLAGICPLGDQADACCCQVRTGCAAWPRLHGDDLPHACVLNSSRSVHHNSVLTMRTASVHSVLPSPRIARLQLRLPLAHPQLLVRLPCLPTSSMPRPLLPLAHASWAVAQPACIPPSTC